ncbi:MAG: ACT domain-containing protein [Planctomycetota bacterium]
MVNEGKKAERGLLVLTAIGRDRPGIVEALSAFVFDRGGSIEDSKMAVLGGEFAVIMLVEGKEEALARIEREADKAGKKEGLSIALKRTTAGRPFEGPTLAYELTGTGLDHPGIVYKISHALREAGANIESVETRARPGAMSGVSVFHAQMRLAAPAGVSIAELRAALEEVAREQNIDIEIRPAE